MIGGSPIASRTITGHKSEFYPITVFFTESLTPDDTLLPADVEATLEDVITLAETLMPSDLEISLEESLMINDYLVALKDDVLIEYWHRVGSLPTTWRRTNRT